MYDEYPDLIYEGIIHFFNDGELLLEGFNIKEKFTKIFRKNKITNYSEYHFLLPYNIHFRFEDEFSKELLYSNDKLFDIVLSSISTHISPEFAVFALKIVCRNDAVEILKRED